jgi:hypothetical protein
MAEFKKKTFTVQKELDTEKFREAIRTYIAEQTLNKRNLTPGEAVVEMVTTWKKA